MNKPPSKLASLVATFKGIFLNFIGLGVAWVLLLITYNFIRDKTEDSFTDTLFHYHTFNVNGVSFDMVLVDSGSYKMGSEYKKAGETQTPAHLVQMKEFYIGKYEVTQALWKAIMGNNPSFFKGDSLPVEQVTWNDCKVFLQKLNKKTGKNFRLPTEEEWEYAAIGGNKSKNFQYAGSNYLDKVAWYYENSGDDELS